MSALHRGRIRGGRAVALGASFVEQDNFAHLQGLMGGRRLWIEKGVGGERSDQISARLTADVLDLDPLLVLIDSGMNDVIQGVAAATIQATNQAMYEACDAAGIEVVICTMQPWANYSGYNATEEAVRVAMNDWVKTRGRPYFDYDLAIGDRASPPALRSNYDSGDGIHTNVAGRVAVSAACFRQAFGGIHF